MMGGGFIRLLREVDAPNRSLPAMTSTTNHRVVRRNVSFDKEGFPVQPPRTISSRHGLARPSVASTSAVLVKTLSYGTCILIPVSYLLFIFLLSFRTDVVYDRLPQKDSSGRNTLLVSNSIPILSDSVNPEKEQTIALPGFDSILQRARQHTELCKTLDSSTSGGFRGFDLRSELPFHNDTVASLPSFGIVSAIQSYLDEPQRRESDAWPICQIPPLHECQETQLTVVFMAYNPDRLGITLKEIKRMFDPDIFFNLVKEVILVWNGERHVDESPDGTALLEFMQEYPVRVVYPLKMGFPNDLMNRYHPRVVQPTTKAILYYDDDGPFYSYDAVIGGFELWKRHPRAQIGAMARQITYSARQQKVRMTLLGAESSLKSHPADDVFVSHCTNVDDQVDYQFRFFANYDANMVLPSGSMLHANYLCFLWHPIFAEIRHFVLMHPVHPDDMTVSMIVSQLAGLAPRVYSRRIDRRDQSKKKERGKPHRRLMEPDENISEPNDANIGLIPFSELQRHRSLMFSICWDCGSGMTEMKQYWAELRTEAVNALVRYFGSINSGSIGWCTYQSEYYDVNKDGRCWPVMAKLGMLPWMKGDGTPVETCP
jgi:Glycosyl transferase family 64 domain